MPVITSRTGARSWATATDWVGNACPVDNVDSAVIDADCQMLMNQDQSAWTGLLGVTVSGHATTPGMLYWKDGVGLGHLKLKTGFNLLGTTGAAKGRVLANSNGTWGATGVLAFADKAVIDLGATSKIDAQYLDIALRCYEPTTKYLRTYGVRHTVTGSAAADTLTKNSHGLANATPVMIMSSGALPGGLAADYVYYVVSTAANTFQLAAVSGGTAIDLTSDGSGTIEVYTGAASSADPVSVFEDVSAETGWTNATGHNRVVVANAGPQNYDQQRLTITTLDTNHIHLSAALDSLQYPGARISLVARNVSIRSACTTAVNIVDYTNATTVAGVFGCEIWASAGTGTTFYGNGIYAGTGHTISGTISGCSYGIYAGSGHTISGTISGCTSGVGNGSGHTISGTISGCAYGVGNGTGHTISGTISGCTNGVYTGTGHTINGTISGCSSGVYAGPGHAISGTISGCTYQFRFDTGAAGLGLLVIVRGSATLSPTTPTFANRNTAGCGSAHGEQCVYCENYQGVLGASRAFHSTADVICNTATVRSGGATSSLQVVPLSECKTQGVRAATQSARVRVFEWTELNVPASAQTKSVYIRGSNATAWSTYPTGGELYFQAEYLNHGTLLTTALATSTAVLTDNTTWVQFPVTFTPLQAGTVRYRVIFGAYEAGAEIFVDNQLVTG